jgi:ABC-2 type transport system permease protein
MILKDRKSHFVVIGSPIIQFFAFGYAATYDLKNVRYAVLDESRGAKPRRLLSRVAGSGYFELTRSLMSEAEIAKVIDRETARLVIHIGPEFDRNLRTGDPATVQVIADGRNPNVALIALGYVGSIVERF